MKVQVDTNRILREWPHVEKYQNTTLRYTPDSSFPQVMEKVIGRPEIIRLFVTLDEVWDYRTNEYHWDYLIGENKYIGDENHYHYDWHLTLPSPLGVHVQEYLTSHAKCANRVLLNIRRYEREVTDGIISIEKYAEVYERVVEYYKELCPNIEYVECCNEVEITNFGNLEIAEYYVLYKQASNAITKLNKRFKYDIPLQTGGFGMSAGISNWKYWDAFLHILSEDKERTIDFYSMHEYHTNPGRILEFYVRHQDKIKELNLPDLPIMMSEYGLRVGIGDTGRPNNLQNASGEIAGMILGSYCHNLKIFPWCSFHNPNQQLGRTMFIQLEDGTYVPTPSGHVMTMFHMLGSKELLIEDYVNNTCVATVEGNRICVLLSNPHVEEEVVELSIMNVREGMYVYNEYMVNKEMNNCLVNTTCISLSATNTKTVNITGSFEIKLPMSGNSFCLVTLDKK